ncbi:MAG: carbon-nitrogen family hydrolase [Desulfobacteraceae bacterium]|nr:carbon-nitrogen family hydrolase [Desulfobacteraceae bacterium]
MFNSGVVQFDIKNGRIKENLKVIFSHLEQLAFQKVRLAVLPEMFSCGFDNEHLCSHAQKTPAIIEELSRFAKEHQMAIAGSLPVNEDTKIYNTMIFIDSDGSVKGTYKKIHLFKLTGEHLFYAAGDRYAVINTSFGRIGLMICYDLRFPELGRILFKKGARIILISAQWPEARKAHWQALSRARAIENQLFVICSNRTGTDGKLEFPGLSMIIDPMGNIIANAGSKEHNQTAQIDLDMIEKTRRQIPCLKDMRDDVC